MNVFKNDKTMKKYFGYIEGVIYIILTIFVIFTNIAGPIIVKLIPVAFFLGVVGRVIFNRPIITSIFGFLISMCTIYMLGTYSFTYNLMYSLFCFISILIGEVEGMYLIRIIKHKSENIKISRNITGFVLFALAGISLNIYVNGNFYSYLKAKQTIKNYINLNYPGSSNATIEDGKYVLNKYIYYSFNVKNIDVKDNMTYKFAVYSDNKVIDEYKSSKLELSSKLLKDKFTNDINLSKYINFKFDIEYTDLKNNITLYITKHVGKINSDELNKFAGDVDNILEDISTFDNFSNISKMNICIKDETNKASAEINSTNFYDKNYYLESLETEYLDN